MIRLGKHYVAWEVLALTTSECGAYFKSMQLDPSSCKEREGTMLAIMFGVPEQLMGLHSAWLQPPSKVLYHREASTQRMPDRKDRGMAR
ncbi:hypothetical protein N7462_008009 [Penicillium macrosclerotiorum]|uniref:uncharacterized protein n=1 Tax=Penicillium macrosclerotiorum TaxID=303699 RepID=UPI002546EC4C|nr:uncharacterized protein N7462_008009 [Penicillium macrosclerotiorum]KAJ5679765.1 hypothetical protein N7462_008009 [Penicillium macrosclerotiorum]